MNLIWVSESPSVNAVVCSVQTSLWKPDNVASLKTACSYGLKITIPVQHRMGLLNMIRCR